MHSDVVEETINATFLSMMKCTPFDVYISSSKHEPSKLNTQRKTQSINEFRIIDILNSWSDEKNYANQCYNLPHFM